MARSGARDLIRSSMGLVMLGLALHHPSISESADGAPRALAGIAAWAVVYAREVDPARLTPFGLVVVDAEVAVPAAALKRSGAKVIAYLSLGEVHRSRAYFTRVEDAGWLVRENASWKGSFLVDVRHEGWRRMVVGELAPAILERGFDGLFLDTLDTAEVLEGEDPARFGGSIREMADLVKALRAKYPTAVLLPNNAFRVLEHVASAVDGVVAESVFATYDFSTKRYHRLADAPKEYKLALLTDVRRRHRLPVFTIEYAPPSEAELTAYAADASRAASFVPYVTTIDLQSVHPPPP